MKSTENINQGCGSRERYIWFALFCIVFISLLSIITFQSRSPFKTQDTLNDLQQTVTTNSVRVYELGIVLLEVTHPDGVTSVPAEAVLNDRNGTFVFVEDFDLKNSFLRATVSVAPSADDRTRVIHGLFPRDQVVVKGSRRLRNEPSIKSKTPDTKCS